MVDNIFDSGEGRCLVENEWGDICSVNEGVLENVFCRGDWNDDDVNEEEY